MILVVEAEDGFVPDGEHVSDVGVEAARAASEDDGSIVRTEQTDLEFHFSP